MTFTPQVTMVAPPDAAAWDALVGSSDEASVFHPSAWARLWTSEWPNARWEALVISSAAAGNAPRYDAALGMIVRDGLLGRRVMAMPWGTYGGPLVRRDHPDPGTARRVLLAAFAERVRGAMVAELTWPEGHRDDLPRGLDAREGFTQVRGLASDFALILRVLPHSVRSRVRQAEEHGLAMRAVADAAGVRAYHALATDTMRRLGARPKPLSLYQRVFDQLVPAGLARFDLVEHQGAPIGGALHLLHRSTALNWLTVADEKHRDLRPNHLLIARVMQSLCEQSYHTYNFGGSPPGAEGLIQFKESWGAERRPVLEVRRRSLLHRLFRG
ncbi:MAG: GNAT family N-acetyltransferase [Candidatus Eisenbacteria bacterium]|nr:GNAT family N-acetyltransferase [Candidatus Eisenbacteria bacterium]